jgi:threonine synthase
MSGISLSSANSINIGRLLPQSVYYFYAWSRLSAGIDDKIVFSVPCGNFGNLMGGLVAREMGLPVYQFIISTNENDEVPSFLKNGNYKSITPSKNCISSAMNVGHPSNLARIVALYDGMMSETGEILISPDLQKMRQDFFAVSITDDATKATIADIFKKYNIILEPHGAIAWKGIDDYFQVNKYINSEKQLCVSLETAHPAKFSDEIREILNVDPLLPSSLAGIEERTENVFSLDNKYESLREFILKYNQPE